MEKNLNHLEWQINNLKQELRFQELTENPDIYILNGLIKRILKSSAVLFVLRSRKDKDEDEDEDGYEMELETAIEKKYMEYFYAFGLCLPRAIVKIEKLNY